MPTTFNNEEESRSVLASLRRLIPDRPLQFAEALQVAEWQASRLLQLSGIDDGPVPTDIVSQLPRVRIERRDLPTSGLSYWNGQVWVICLNRSEPATRQRFTLFHEYKHIVDHGRADRLYRGAGGSSPDEQAEQAADYFAGCVLMPRTFLKRAWGHGLQRPTVLAALFDVSPRAVSVRLAQTGLSQPLPRCASRSRPNRRPYPGRYHRQLSVNWPTRSEPTLARALLSRETAHA